MKEREHILQRYSEMKNKGLELYFDADEIADLLEHFEIAEDFDQYEKVVKLGQKLHPESMDIKIGECKVHIFHERYDKALKLIEQMGESDTLELTLLKMECLCALDRFGEVINFIETQQRIQPDEELESLFEYLTSILNEIGKPNEAYNLVTRGLALFPDNMILKEELCCSLDGLGRIPEAIRVCNEMIDTNPYSTDYWYILGRLYVISEDYGKAAEAFDFALTCEESNVEIKILKAFCLFLNENYEKAIEVYLDLLSQKEDVQERVQPMLAECYMRADDFEQAYILFNELLRNTGFEKELAICKNYIHCCLETEREQEAADVLSMAIDRFPNDLLLVSLQVFVSIIRDEHEKFVDAMRRQLELFYQIGLTGENPKRIADHMPELLYDLKSTIIPTVREAGVDFTLIHSTLICLVKGDIKSFCRQYALCPPDVISEYLKQVILPLATQNKQLQLQIQNTAFLGSDEIRREDKTPIASDRLSSSYINNKYNSN
jgi:tetratricopeptide (TPR) repeat protein